jgi:hypothetical protein
VSASARRSAAERFAGFRSAFLIVCAVLAPAVGNAADAPVDSAAAVPADTTNIPGLEVHGATEGRPIGSIVVAARGIFEPAPPGRFQSFYKFVDAVHVTTRSTTVRQLLPLEPGDVWTEQRGREAMRILRDLRILIPERLEAVGSGDSVRVEVETRDAWSTQFEFTAAGGGGQVVGAIGLVESNLFGLGKLIALSYRDDAVSSSRSIELKDPAVLGSRVRFGFLAADGSDGASEALRIGVPFYAENVRHSWGFDGARTTSIARLFLNDVETADFDRRRERFELWYGRGHQAGRSIWRGTASFRLDDRRLGPSRLAPDAPPDFAGEEDNHRVRQPTLDGWYWRPKFVERRNVDELGGIEDFDLGTTLRVTGGFSFQALGATADEGYLSVQAGAGGVAGPLGYGWVKMEAESRFRQIPQEGRIVADGRWIAPLGGRHVLVVGARAEKLKRPARDLQVIYGGLNGLRAFGVHELAGEAGWRWNFEERWSMTRPLFGVAQLGSALFFDAAQIDGPGIDAPRFCSNAGVGLRMSIPRFGSRRVARLDAAWPIDGSRTHDVVWSFGSSQAF